MYVKISCKGTVYHVTVRGNRRNNIFRDKEDYEWSSYRIIIGNKKKNLVSDPMAMLTCYSEGG